MLSDRLKRAMEEAGVSQAELARACGVSPPSVNGWLSGKSKYLRGENLLSAARSLRVSQQWLANGVGPMHLSAASGQEVDLEAHPDLSPIRKVRLRLEAGVSGYAVESEEGEGVPIFFRNDWLRDRGYKASNLVAVKVRGGSMETSLYDGDTVVLNTAETEPKDGEVFAVNYEGEAVIKRMARDGGLWWLTSDNLDQRRYPRKQCDNHSCIVIGRVIHKQSERI